MTSQLDPMMQRQFRLKGYECVYTIADAYDVLYNNGLTIGVIESTKRKNIFFAEFRMAGIADSELYGHAVGSWHEAMIEAINIGFERLKSRYE